MALKKAPYISPLIPVFIQEIAEAAGQILSYTKDTDFSGFVKNKMLCDAVQHQFEILGEASTHIPSFLRKKYKHIPWNMMYSLRNHIAHEYFDIDYEIIWEIIVNDLPADHANLEKMRKEYHSGQGA